MDEAKIEAAKSKYPDRDLVKLTSETSRGIVEGIAKIPNKPEIDMWREQIFKDKTRATAQERLLRTVLVVPEDKAGADELFNRFPGVVEKWADQLLEHSGMTEKTTSSKL